MKEVCLIKKTPHPSYENCEHGDLFFYEDELWMVYKGDLKTDYNRKVVAICVSAENNWMVDVNNFNKLKKDFESSNVKISVTNE